VEAPESCAHRRLIRLVMDKASGRFSAETGRDRSTGVSQNCRPFYGILKNLPTTFMAQRKKKPRTTEAQALTSTEDFTVRTLEPLNPAMLSEEESLREEGWASWEARRAKRKQAQAQQASSESVEPHDLAGLMTSDQRRVFIRSLLSKGKEPVEGPG
jgi:hypothetical protein